MIDMACEGCVFQKYRVIDGKQMWFCRLESEDVCGNNVDAVYHENEESKRKCIYGYGDEE